MQVGRQGFSLVVCFVRYNSEKNQPEADFSSVLSFYNSANCEFSKLKNAIS